MTPESEKNSPSVLSALLLGMHFKKTNPQKAEECLRRAAEHGNEDAMAHLAFVLKPRAQKEESPDLYSEALDWAMKAGPQREALDFLEKENGGTNPF